jgi:hypothetical protein
VAQVNGIAVWAEGIKACLGAGRGRSWRSGCRRHEPLAPISVLGPIRLAGHIGRARLPQVSQERCKLPDYINGISLQPSARKSPTELMRFSGAINGILPQQTSRMARPKTTRETRRVSSTLDQQTFARLEAMAKAHKVATAWLIRRVIEEFVERNPPDNPSPWLPSR